MPRTEDLSARTVLAFADLYLDAMERAASDRADPRLQLEATERFMDLREAVHAHRAVVQAAFGAALADRRKRETSS